MNNYIYIKATDSTPEVVLDRPNKLYRISGDILPENALEFFEPILSFFDTYALNPDKKLTVELLINIINTSSTRRLVILFKKFEKMVLSKKINVDIIWSYLVEDEVMQYTVFEFSNLFKNLNFKIRLK